MYLPVDNKKVNEVNNEVIETINDINNTIEENPADELMITGDLNADFSRNSEQSETRRADSHDP